MKGKKLQLWLPLLLSAVMVVGMVLGYKLRKDTVGPNAFLSNYDNVAVAQVLNLIRKNYVDNVNPDSLQIKAINNILQQLDPYSVYLPADKRMEMYDEKNGYFTGLGINYEMINDSVFITDVTKGSPAFLSGIKVGDIFLSLNDSLKVSGKEKGSVGVAGLIKQLNNPIKINIDRQGKSLIVEVKKSVLGLPSIDADYMIDSKTAYVRVGRFSETTYKEFMYALEMLKRKGMQQLMIDLRGNSGGVMTSAIEIANEFLKDNQLIVYTDGSKVGKKEYRCKRDGLYTDLKLEVLIDETSASASEILAGALQDWDRAAIIGRRSFGKGFVENQYKLDNGSAVRLTIARYYTPLGRSVQKPYKNVASYTRELATRFHNGEAVLGDTSSPKEKQYKTPKGRIIYGGGGIMPDVVVPYDSTILPAPVVKLYLKSVLNKFSFIYYMRHPDVFSNFQSARQVDSLLSSQKDVIWNSLNEFALKQDTVDIRSIDARTKEDIWNKFLAFTAENKFGAEGYFERNNQADSVFQKALQMINN